MMSYLDDAIEYIDMQIGNMVQYMLEARKKHLDAINIYLTKLLSLEVDGLTELNYRLGYTYDRIVKVERDYLPQKDVLKPKLKLNYVGNKMNLSYNETGIQVPEVPIFVFDLKPMPKNIHDVGIGTIAKNTLLQLPTTVSPSEPPDIENSFGKYYYLPLKAHVEDVNSVTFDPAYKIALPLPIISITEISWNDFYSIGITLHIGGYSYDFYMYLRPCVIKYNQVDLSGSAVTDLKANGIYISSVTQYQDEHYWVIFNNRFPKGKLEAGYRVKRIVMFDFQNLTLVRSIE